MSTVCLSCARRGKKDGCTLCASIAPTPRHLIVKGIIERVAKEHRLAQIAAERDFRSDFEETEAAKSAAEAYRAKCRRREYREKIKQAQEAV